MTGTMTSPDQTPLSVESLSFEFGQIAEQAARMVERRDYSQLQDFPASYGDLVDLARLIHATNLNLSKLCKGMGQ